MMSCVIKVTLTSSAVNLQAYLSYLTMLGQDLSYAELSDSIYLSGREARRFRVISNLHRQPSAHETNSLLRILAGLAGYVAQFFLSLVVLLPIIPNFLSFHVYNVHTMWTMFIQCVQLFHSSKTMDKRV